MVSSSIIFSLLYILLNGRVEAFQDEFAVRGPGELHKAALDAILEERRANPGGNDAFSEDSAMMQRAREYAIKRFISKPEEALKAAVRDMLMPPCNILLIHWTSCSDPSSAVLVGIH